MVKYWRDQWCTKKRALKEELVQSVRIFMRCCRSARDSVRELERLMEQHDMPALRTRLADSAAGRSRVGADSLARFDRWRFAYCDFAADVFHCLYAQHTEQQKDRAIAREAADRETERHGEVKRPRVDLETSEETTHTTEAGIYGRPSIYSDSYTEYTHQDILTLLATSAWTSDEELG